MSGVKRQLRAIIILLSFFVFLFPYFLYAENQFDVVINEIAWMGTANSASDEWIELYNNTENEIDLNGWVLEAVDGSPKILLKEKIAAKSFYLLERTDDDSVPDIIADLLISFGYGLSNNGEHLFLKNSDGEIIDTVDCSSGWFAGDKESKKTMERKDSSFSGSDANNWHLSKDISGTPKAVNSENDEILNQVQDDNGDDQYDNENQEDFIENNDSVVIPEQAEIQTNFKSFAGSNVEIFVGQKLLFDASASQGINGETKYLWNFGDGFTSKDQKIYHSYLFPGEYMAVLKITKGNFSDTSARTVKVLDNNIVISEFVPDMAGKDDNEWIEIYNKSEQIIDIGGWQIDDSEKGSSPFTIPENTFLTPKNYLVFTKEATKLSLNNSNDSVRLLKKNSVVDEVKYIETYEGYSLNRISSDEAVWSKFATPGAQNIILEKSDEKVSILKGVPAEAVKTNNFSVLNIPENYVLKEKEIFDNFVMINSAQAQEIENENLQNVNIYKYEDASSIEAENKSEKDAIKNIYGNENLAVLPVKSLGVMENANTKSSEKKKNNSLLIITFCVGALGSFAVVYIDKMWKK